VEVAHPMVAYIQQGNSTVLVNLAEWVISYQETFIVPGHGIEDHVTHPEKKRLREVGNAALAPLLAFIREEVGVYMDRVLAVFSENLASNVEFATLIEGLSIFCAGTKGLSDLVPEAELQPVDVAATTVRQLCRMSGEQLQSAFTAKISALTDTLNADPGGGSGIELEKMSVRLGRWVETETRSVLHMLRGLLESDLATSHSFFQGEFQNRCVRVGIIQGMIGFMIEYVGGFAGSPTGGVDAKPMRVAAPITHQGPPTLVLLLAHFSQQLASKVVQRLVKMGSNLFATDTEDEQDRGESDSLAVSQKSTQCEKAASALVARYVDVHSSALSRIIRESVARPNWLAMEQPTTVNQGFKDMVTLVDGINEIVSRLYSGTDAPKDSRKGRFAVARSSTSGMTMNVQKLFSERTDVYTAVDFDRSSIMFAIIKRICKAYLENIRLCTFGRHGFQQVEIDVHYVGTSLWHFTNTETKEAFVHTMLSQVVTGASARCLDPEHLEVGVLDTICEEGGLASTSTA